MTPRKESLKYNLTERSKGSFLLTKSYVLSYLGQESSFFVHGLFKQTQQPLKFLINIVKALTIDKGADHIANCVVYKKMWIKRMT